MIIFDDQSTEFVEWLAPREFDTVWGYTFSSMVLGRQRKGLTDLCETLRWGVESLQMDFEFPFRALTWDPDGIWSNRHEAPFPANAAIMGALQVFAKLAQRSSAILGYAHEILPDFPDYETALKRALPYVKSVKHGHRRAELVEILGGGIDKINRDLIEMEKMERPPPDVLTKLHEEARYDLAMALSSGNVHTEGYATGAVN